MKILTIGFAVLLSACSQQPPNTVLGEPSSWVSPDQVRPLVEKYIAKHGYVDVRLVEERAEGRICRYRFATNDIVVAESVVVDRKSGRITLELISHTGINQSRKY